MLYVEFKWNKLCKTGNIGKKRVSVGHRALFIVKGAGSEFTKKKIQTFPEEYSMHQWFQILVFDNLSNIAENSPLSNKRLRQSLCRCQQIKPGTAWKRKRKNHERTNSRTCHFKGDI